MKDWQHKSIAALGALLIFATLAVAITSTDPWSMPGADGVEDITTIADALFTDYVIALEALGILLTAAMIGAMVIARPLGVPMDRQHYVQVSPELLARTMDVSDVEHPAYIRAPIAMPTQPAALPGEPVGERAGAGTGAGTGAGAGKGTAAAAGPEVQGGEEE